VRGGDERSHLRLGVEWIADLDPAGELGHLRHRVVVQGFLDEHPRPRLAALPCGVEDRPCRGRDGARKIGVGEHEVRALPAQLERDPLHRVGREPHDLPAGPRRAREGHLVDARMSHEIGTRRRAVAGDDIQSAGREADLDGELGQANRGQRRLRVGLEHDGAARRERGGELPGRHHQWVVPGDDLSRDPDGLLQRVEEEGAADRVRAARRSRRSLRHRSGSSRPPGRARP
jgi:hypothetical protein